LAGIAVCLPGRYSTHPGSTRYRIAFFMCKILGIESADLNFLSVSWILQYRKTWRKNSVKTSVFLLNLLLSITRLAMMKESQSWRLQKRDMPEAKLLEELEEIKKNLI
jgi:hypothetical protein